MFSFLVNFKGACDYGDQHQDDGQHEGLIILGVDSKDNKAENGSEPHHQLEPFHHGEAPLDENVGGFGRSKFVFS